MSACAAIAMKDESLIILLAGAFANTGKQATATPNTPERINCFDI